MYYSLHVGILFSFWPRVFFCVLISSGARRKHARIPRSKCGPWPRSLTRALRLPGRKNWQTSTARHCEHVEPSRRMQTHIVKNTSNRCCPTTSCSCSGVDECSSVRVLLPVLSYSRARPSNVEQPEAHNWQFFGFKFFSPSPAVK